MKLITVNSITWDKRNFVDMADAPQKAFFYLAESTYEETKENDSLNDHIEFLFSEYYFEIPSEFSKVEITDLEIPSIISSAKSINEIYENIVFNQTDVIIEIAQFYGYEEDTDLDTDDKVLELAKFVYTNMNQQNQEG